MARSKWPQLPPLFSPNSLKKLLLVLLCGTALAHTSAAQNVNGRLNNQRQRIDNGRATGELSQGQARELRGEARGVQQQVRAERQANGGRLTGGERRQANHELNQDSRQIRRAK